VHGRLQWCIVFVYIRVPIVRLDTMLNKLQARPCPTKRTLHGILPRHVPTVPVAQRAETVRCKSAKDAERKVAHAGTAVLVLLVLTTGASFLLAPPIPSANAVYLEPVEMARKLIIPPSTSNEMTHAALPVAYNDMATLATRTSPGGPPGRPEPVPPPGQPKPLCRPKAMPLPVPS